MVIDEVYRILQYAFDNKLTIKEAVTKFYAYHILLYYTYFYM